VLPWFDEFFTLFISRISSFPEMFQAMPADGQPPLNYLLTHISLRLFGESALALRLPQVAAYMITGPITYRIVRTHGNAIQAIFAMALLLGAQTVAEQAHTARPYALLLCFTAIAFACWQTAAGQTGRRNPALVGLSLAIACAILSHHYGVVYVCMFLGAGEGMRLIRARRFDGWMAVSIAVGLCSLFLTVPMARASERLLFDFTLHAPGYFARPRPATFLLYPLMAALPLLFLVAASLILVRPERKTSGHRNPPLPVPAHEWAAAIALTLLLPVLMLAAKFGTGVVFPRYVFGTALGVALLCGWGVARLQPRRTQLTPLSATALATHCYLFLTVLMLVVEMMHKPIWNASLETEGVSPVLRDAPSILPIVVANAMEYPVEWWYAQPSLRSRMVYLSDLPNPVGHADDVLAELSLTEDQAYIPLRTAEYAAFLSARPHFLLLCTGSGQLNWVKERMVREGWHLTPIAAHDKDVLYNVDRP
jgi:hypothetical protein